MTGQLERIVLSKADITDLERDLVMEALHSGWVTLLGPSVEAFESALAERIGVTHALALSSGTAALHLALLDAGAGPGRAVVLPSMTFAASANAVAYTGAEPVFVDCRGDDANLDVDLLDIALATLRAEGVDIAAVMSVDLFGRCVDYGALTPLLERAGIPLVEDAAEALGATHEGRAAGSFGQAAALSFNGNKILTTAGGGMLLSDDGDLIDRARYLATQARQPVAWYEHTEVGFNYRMSNILAALGVGQLRRLDQMIARRRAIRRRYAEALGQVPGVRFLGAPDGDLGADNCWLTCLVLDVPGGHVTPAQVIAHLDARGIEARHLWKPMHLQPLYAGARMFETGAGAALFASGLALPSGSGLSDDDIDRVIAALVEVLAPGDR